MRSGFALLASAVMVLLAGCATHPSAANKDKPLPRPNSQESGLELWSQVRDRTCKTQGGPFAGNLEPRECVLGNIRNASKRNDMFDVRQYVDQLAGFYELRARRQQQFSDVLAGGSFVGSLGAGLSGRVGAATQRAWLGAAFLPVMITNANANEPTRDLFHAGGLALKVIDARYRRLDETRRSIETIGLLKIDCSPSEQILGVVSAWAFGDDRTVVLPEAERILAECHLAASASKQLELVANAAKSQRRRWPGDLASAVIKLDQILVGKDRQFRYSPAETLGAIAAAPFRTLDTILSGQDATEALNKLQTAAAFTGMDMSLEPLSLPIRSTPPTVTGRELSGAALARLAIGPRQGGQPAKEDVDSAVNSLQREALNLVAAQRQLHYLESLMEDFYRAAAATELRFSFNTTTSAVTVELGPPP